MRWTDSVSHTVINGCSFPQVAHQGQVQVILIHTRGETNQYKPLEGEGETCKQPLPVPLQKQILAKYLATTITWLSLLRLSLLSLLRLSLLRLCKSYECRAGKGADTLIQQIAKVLQHASGTVETTIDLPHMNLIIFPASACPSSLFKHSESIVVFHCSACLLKDLQSVIFISLPQIVTKLAQKRQSCMQF